MRFPSLASRLDRVAGFRTPVEFERDIRPQKLCASLWIKDGSSIFSRENLRDSSVIKFCSHAKLHRHSPRVEYKLDCRMRRTVTHVDPSQNPLSAPSWGMVASSVRWNSHNVNPRFKSLLRNIRPSNTSSSGSLMCWNSLPPSDGAFGHHWQNMQDSTRGRNSTFLSGAPLLRPSSAHGIRQDRVRQPWESRFELEVFSDSASIEERAERCCPLTTGAIGWWLADGGKQRSELGRLIIHYVINAMGWRACVEQP